MAFRGRGRGFAKEEKYEIFPEIKQLPDVNLKQKEEEFRTLVSWGNDLQKFWISSPYHLEDVGSGSIIRRPPLSDYDDYVPVELVTFVIIAISIILSFVVLTVRASRKEMMCLRAALIKQKEATQEAERKKMNHSLAFVSASHDIRAFLAGIDGSLELSMDNVHQGSELAEHLTNMQKCSKELKSLLNSILDTSKIEAGKMQLEEKQFDLASTVESVVDLFYPVGLKKQVDVILDLQDGSLTKYSLVKGDERRLKQILPNLLSNAIKFTSEGYVIVRASVRKPRLHKSTSHSSFNQSRRCLSCFFFKNDHQEAIDDHLNFMEFVF